MILQRKKIKKFKFENSNRLHLCKSVHVTRIIISLQGCKLKLATTDSGRAQLQCSYSTPYKTKTEAVTVSKRPTLYSSHPHLHHPHHHVTSTITLSLALTYHSHYLSTHTNSSSPLHYLLQQSLRYHDSSSPTALPTKKFFDQS